MTHEELKSRLPHRDAMLLVGEVTTKDGDENTAVERHIFAATNGFYRDISPEIPSSPELFSARSWLSPSAL